ncbi:hypothetical protein K8I85_06940 [bacterium]|nr:hypothetical protein [bacterium]
MCAGSRIRMTSAPPIRLVIGCDTDPDRLDFGGIAFDRGSSPQVWNGVARVPHLRERLEGIHDSRGRRPAVTWFLRCDEQIRATEGSYDAALHRFADLWRQLEEAGDEIGWHPHFWRLQPDGRVWFHEIDDEEFQRTMLREAHAAFVAARGSKPASVRMGWDYHSNASMETLSELGIRIDLSALPYQSFAGARDDRGASFAGFYDWSTTGTLPYHPSAADYRLPGEGDRLAILALPQNLLRSRLAAVLAEARGALRDRSPARLMRALSPNAPAAHSTVKICSPPFLFRSMVTDVLRRGEDWIVTYFHPDELLDRKGSFVNDVIHRLSYFVENVRTVVRVASRHGRPVHFLTAAQAAEELGAPPGD